MGVPVSPPTHSSTPTTSPPRHLPRDHAVPDATRLSREERESWIRAKYEQRLFLAPLPATEVPLGEQLFCAVQEKDLETVLLLLAHSKKEQLNVSTGDKDRRTALHVACDMALVVITQLLVWVCRGAGGGEGDWGVVEGLWHGMEGHRVGTGHMGRSWGSWHGRGGR